MDSCDHAKYYKLLDLPPDATIQELDERYFDIVEHWAVQERRGHEDAKQNLRLTDEAYGALLQKLIREQDRMSVPTDQTWTMQQVVNGQERIIKPSTSDDDQWLPPPRQRSPPPVFDEDIDMFRDMELEPRIPKDKDMGTAPGFFIREIEGDVKDAPDRAVIVRM